MFFLPVNYNFSLFCQPFLAKNNSLLLFFAAGHRDVYLIFKLLNVSKTGSLSEDEFASIYGVISLKWKVINSLQCFFVSFVCDYSSIVSTALPSRCSFFNE